MVVRICGGHHAPKKGLFHMNFSRKRLYNRATTCLVLVVVVLAVLLVGVRLFGFTPYTVLSGSMEPTYPVGSLIYVKKVDTADLQVGDPITFVFDQSLTVATHRVVELDPAEGYAITKGDANEAVDGSPVAFENILGRPVFCVPYLGFVATFLQTPPTSYLAICVALLLLVMLFLPDLLSKGDKKQAMTAPKLGD